MKFLEHVHLNAAKYSDAAVNISFPVHKLFGGREALLNFMGPDCDDEYHKCPDDAIEVAVSLLWMAH